MDSTFTVTLKKTGTMQFTSRFDKNYPNIIFDEPAEFGGDDQYPNASRILTAAVASCLAASLSLCLNKVKMPVDMMELKAKCTTTHTDEGYIRIKQINVQIHPKWTSDINEMKVNRCIRIFKNYCIATNAITNSVPVKVDVQLNDQKSKLQSPWID